MASSGASDKQVFAYAAIIEEWISAVLQDPTSITPVAAAIKTWFKPLAPICELSWKPTA